MIKSMCVIAVSFVLMSAGCKDGKKPEKEVRKGKPEQVQDDPVVSETPVTGVVTNEYYSHGCDFLIKVDGMSENDTYHLIYPVALDSTYLQNGLKLRFTFYPSRAFSGKCTKGMPAVLQNIEVLK
jgi:hypothetical protein